MLVIHHDKEDYYIISGFVDKEHIITWGDTTPKPGQESLSYKGYDTYSDAKSHKYWLECSLDQGGMCVVKSAITERFYVCDRDYFERNVIVFS